ncbi:MAG: hypothetical protein K1X92_15555 [Bacteroidia bacterium]|nr:hypothetical protein [Bacteroidia bacterium]
METIEKIESYLEGKMTAEEKASFEQEMAQNAELREEVEVLNDVINGVKSEGQKDFMKMVHHWEKEIVAREVAEENKTGEAAKEDKVIPLNTPKKKGINWIIRIAAAACILVLIGVGYQQFFNYQSPGELYTESFSPFNASNARDDSNTNITRAITYYNNSDFGNAYPLLKEELGKNPDAANLNLYAGICALSVNDDGAATTYFQKVISLNNPNFTDAAEWYLAILPLKSGNAKLAKQRLHVIRNKTGHDYREIAKKLFRKLK